MSVAPVASPSPKRTPRQLSPGLEPSDRVFEGFSLGIGAFVLILTGAVGLFLGLQSIPTFRHYGFHFFTTVDWNPELDKVGIAAVLLGTFEVALVAMIVSFPIALAFALFISDYAPKWLKGWLISAVDLMAAVPSIIYGIWGFYLLKPHAMNLARWLSQHFGWFPLFHVNTDPNAAVWQQSQYTSSAFIAGIAVSMMAIPLACAVMRAVFDQAPLGEREAAMALGGTQWGVVKTVVLPFGKGGIIGGTMLALGRALGETAAVAIILSPAYILSPRILQSGAQTTSGLIASNFGNASKSQLSALLTAGFVLFVITLIVNSTAAVVIGRSRSGAATEI
jgi:phosphate transport system permease protein